MSDMFAMLSALDDTPVVRESYVRAPFAYPGSKAASLKEILPRLPYREGYCEPFGGTGSVLLSRNESKFEVLNDRFAGVTAFYRCVRDRTKLDALINRLTLCLHSREEFIWCRDTWKNCDDEIERAARWYYSVIMSFSSKGANFGRSLNSKGKLSPKLARNLQFFYPVHFRLQRVLIENLDWRECFKDFDSPSMVWYLDPPYLNTTNTAYEHELSRECHVELCERIQNLRGFVALSGYQNDFYDKYKWDRKVTWKVSVSILGMAFTETNHFVGKEGEMVRDDATEVLWIRESRD